MKIPDVVSELELEMVESQNQRDERVEELWRKLDPQGKGELDFKGLQKGLRRIDHPMKNAEDMLREIVTMVDKNGDGKIQYEEFRVFVEAAERQLLLLFRSIDRDHDGRVDKEELRAAFRKVGMAVPLRRLSGFFDKIDMNHDGFISFDEWRDFLLFFPTHDGDSPLEAAYSFYSSIVTLTAEGDSLVSDETLEGLGTTGILFRSLFGSLLKLADPDILTQHPYWQPSRHSSHSFAPPRGEGEKHPPLLSSELAPPLPPPATVGHDPNYSSSSPLSPPPSSTTAAISASDHQPHNQHSMAVLQPGDNAVRGILSGFDDEEPLDFQQIRQLHQILKAHAPEAPKLTSYLPEPGYFLAGAIAGGVSRTATAPLDRLKVYLLVNTNTGVNPALAAAKNGQPLVAVKKAGRPISDAIMSLWRAGGFRTFFAGNGLNVVKIMPETAIKFGTYEAAKRTLANMEGHGDPKRINPYSKFVAGGVAGMMAQFFVYPLDTLKFRLQCETVEGGLKGNALLIQTARKMWASGGMSAAYRGITMGLIGMFPYSAIDMGTFELLKSTFRRYKARYHGLHEEDVEAGNIVTGVMGAASGAFGATVVYPLNVLRTRLQTQGTVMHPPTYTGIADVARRTIRNEGYRGLYKGLTPNLLKVAPALSITWVCYENSKKLLGLH